MKTRHTVLGMLASAIVAFQMGSLLSAWSDLSPSFTGQISLAASEHNAPFGGSAGDAVLMKDEQQKQLNLTQQDPFYWIADEQDDFYERIYVDPTPLTHLRRNLTIKHFFPHLCGLYRFDTERLPTVSVVIPLRNEVPGMVSITVHAILARTPPSLLVEIIIVDDSDEKLNPELRHLTEVSGYNKVIVIPTTDREGCARSRLIGARVARGTILVFVDSHVEMLSSTWYQHLVLPIVENPHTVTSQQLQVMGDWENHTYDDPVSRGSPYGTTTDKFNFKYEAYRYTVENPIKKEHLQSLPMKCHLHRVLSLQFARMSFGAWAAMTKDCMYGVEKTWNSRSRFGCVGVVSYKCRAVPLDTCIANAMCM